MLVLDANILIRAVLGVRALAAITEYAGRVRFLAPTAAFDEARAHLPKISLRRPIGSEDLVAVLDTLKAFIEVIEESAYTPRAGDARQRIAKRDPDDWHVLALALTFGCAVWTEDTDFFGVGVATWTTDRIELALGLLSAEPTA